MKFLLIMSMIFFSTKGFSNEVLKASASILRPDSNVAIVVLSFDVKEYLRGGKTKNNAANQVTLHPNKKYKNGFNFNQVIASSIKKALENSNSSLDMTVNQPTVLSVKEFGNETHDTTIKDGFYISASFYGRAENSFPSIYANFDKVTTANSALKGFLEGEDKILNQTFIVTYTTEKIPEDIGYIIVKLKNENLSSFEVDRTTNKKKGLRADELLISELLKRK